MPFQVGDSVLADFNGAQIPGVIEDTRQGEYYVRLAEPWTDETGQQSDTLWIPEGRLAENMQETGGEQALPG